jgi:PAS domain S-box-containing protein
MSTTRVPDDQRRKSPGAAHLPAEIHRLMVASVVDYAIFALDPEGHVASWNEGAQRMKGYAEEEILGRHFSTFYPEELASSGHPEHELEVARSEGRYEEEGWRVRKDGSLFWANVVITAIRGDDDGLVGFVKVTRDLTERRASEMKALEDARRVAEAEAANRAKGQFLMALSHELRTPLNAIGGYVDLLAMGLHGPITGAQHDSLERIRSSQQHLLALITDLLTLSRIEAGRLEYHLEDVALTRLVNRVRVMIEPLAEARGLTLEWEHPVDEVTVRVDPDKFDQILLNLLSNAVKYTETGGRITVAYGADGDRAAILVEDTGIGIPADQTEVIFDAFTQVGRTYSRPQEGVGLGLAISRDLARGMSGDITVESEVDRGSTFTLTLPLAAGD